MARRDDGDAPDGTADTVADSPRALAGAAAGEEGGGDARYRPLVEIGRGGMGRVVEAIDTRLGRRVALKEALVHAGNAGKRFARETWITARLEHPSIVPLYDAGTGPDGAPYYVMRRVSGDSLDKLIDSAKTLADRLALVPHVVAATNAIAHAHKRRVLHRDLKPSNILVGELGETVVIDWGLAKVIDDDAGEPEVEDGAPAALETRAGQVFGTPGFMSPEQLRGTDVDERSDVYALGATLYMLLTGDVPHRASSSNRMMTAAATAPPPPIAKVVPGVPADLAWIVDKALAFDVATRYPDAGALAADLQAFLTGRLVASRRYTLGQRLRRFVARHRLVLAVTAVATVVAVGAGAFAIARIVEERGVALDALAKAELERVRAGERLVEQTLAQARTLLATNPSAAVATVKPLARGPHWREVRAIGAAARSAGACRTVPGPAEPVAIRLAPDGTHAASVGRGGDVWLQDLVAGTAKQVWQRDGDRRARVHVRWAGDRLLAYEPSAAALFDLDGTRRAVPVDGLIASAAGSRDELFVVGTDGTLVIFDAVTLTPQRVPLFDVHDAVPSPDGKLLAIGTGAGLAIVERATGATSVVDGPVTTEIRWGAESSTLVVYRGGQRAVAVVAQRAGGWIEVAAWPSATDVVFDGSEPHGGVRDEHGWEHFVALSRPLDPRTKLLVGDRGAVPTTVAVTREHGYVRLVPGHVLVSASGMDLRLIAPGDAMVADAAPDSPYIVAGLPGQVAIWRAELLLPRISLVEDDPVETPAIFATGPTQVVLVWDALGPAKLAWRDLVTGAEDIAPVGGPFLNMSSVGDIVVTHYTSESRKFISPPPPEQMTIVERGHAPLVVDGEPDVVAIAGRRVLAGTHGGAVDLFDLATSDPRSRVATHDAPVVGVAARAGWLSARWADGTLWLRNPQQHETRAKVAADELGPIHQLSDGRACTPSGAAIVCLEPGAGSVVTLATLPHRVMWWHEVDAQRALVELEGGTFHRVDLTTGAMADILADARPDQEFAASGSFGVAIHKDGRLVVSDVETDTSWSLVTTDGFPDQVTVTERGIVALVHRTGDRTVLATWRLELPGTPEATAAWLDELTNGTLVPGTNRLTW